MEFTAQSNSQAEEGSVLEMGTRKHVAIALFIIMMGTVCCTAVSPTVATKGKVMKVATVHPPTHPFAITLESFARRVGELTGGSVEVQVYSSGQLGQERDQLEGIQIGTIEAGIATTAVLAAFNKDFEIFSLPFLFSDADALSRAYEGPVGQKYAKKLENSNMLTWKCWVVGPRGVYSKKPINSLNDIRGMKVRTLESPIYLDTWKALGAIPTPLPFGEVYTALQTGLVDAAEGSMLGLITAKHGEVVKYFADIQYVISGNAVVIGKSFYDKLTVQEKAAVRTALDEATVLVKKLLAAQDADTLRQVKDLYKVTITKPERAPFREAVRSIYANYKAYEADIDHILAQQ